MLCDTQDEAGLRNMCMHYVGVAPLRFGIAKIEKICCVHSKVAEFDCLDFLGSFLHCPA